MEFGKPIHNWKEYIDAKFVPREDFRFETVEDSSSLTVSHSKTTNVVFFYWPSDDWMELADVQHYSEKTRGWEGDLGPVPFNEENVKAINRFLEPVFTSGWSSKDIFILGDHWKSIVSSAPDLKGSKMHFYSSEGGWPTLIFFPVYWMLRWFAELGIGGRTEIVNLDPIEGKER